jgi:hypothetical protein
MCGQEARLEASLEAKLQLNRLNNSHGGGDKTCLEGTACSTTTILGLFA